MGPILGHIPLPITGRIITVEMTVGTKLGRQSLKALKVAENSSSFNREKAYSSAMWWSLLHYYHLCFMLSLNAIDVGENLFLAKA